MSVVLFLTDWAFNNITLKRLESSCESGLVSILTRLCGLQPGEEGGQGRWWQKEAGTVVVERSRLRTLLGPATDIARTFRAPPRHDRRRGSRRPMPSVFRVEISSGFRRWPTGAASANNSLPVYLNLAGCTLAGVESPAGWLTDTLLVTQWGTERCAGLCWYGWLTDTLLVTQCGTERCAGLCWYGCTCTPGEHWNGGWFRRWNRKIKSTSTW